MRRIGRGSGLYRNINVSAILHENEQTKKMMLTYPKESPKDYLEQMILEHVIKNKKQLFIPTFNMQRSTQIVKLLDEIYKTLGQEQYEKKKDELVEVVLNGMSKLEKKEILKRYMDNYVDNLYMLDEMFEEYKNNKKEKGE